MARPLQWYGMALAFFHVSELALEWLHNRQEFDFFGSLLISKPYVLAHGVGLLEFGVESWLLPSMKAHEGLMWRGVFFVVLGESIRKAGIIVGKHNFTHQIRRSNADKRNVLVKHGIYKWVRHPGYLGWFIWAPATQVVLMNPLCTIAFTVVAQRFFRERIPYEEQYLRQFFPQEYEDYARQTSSWIPGIA